MSTSNEESVFTIHPLHDGVCNAPTDSNAGVPPATLRSSVGAPAPMSPLIRGRVRALRQWTGTQASPPATLRSSVKRWHRVITEQCWSAGLAPTDWNAGVFPEKQRKRYAHRL